MFVQTWIPVFCCFVYIYWSLDCTEAVVMNTTTTRDEIVKALFDNYQSHVIPNELTREQTVVMVYITISAITSVDVRTMEFTADMLLRQIWQDKRLAWDNIPEFGHYNKNIVSPVFKDRIWLPDLFFRNGKQGRLHNMTGPNLLIRINPSGEVLYSQKITMRLACQMQLHTFPMDTQECHMNIGSYGYTLEQVRFVWREDSPVTLDKNLQISEFDSPQTVTPHDCSDLYSTSTGQYTCLNATFILSRQIGYWLASTYVPNILIMVVSWLNFWVSLEATPARVNLSLLTLLGVITQSTSYASALPRVSYIKAIDVWTIACIVFNSGVLLEFAIASRLDQQRKVSEWQNDVRKMVRSELARWCTACQKHYDQRGPSAAMAYLMPGSAGIDKTNTYFNSATSAAIVLQSTPVAPSSSQLSVRLGKSGKFSVVSDRDSPNKSGGFDRNRIGLSSTYEQNAETVPLGFEGTLTDALLSPDTPSKPKVAKKPPRVSPIDTYSRILFPVCFLIYNCCYWLYYLVLVKQAH